VLKSVELFGVVDKVVIVAIIHFHLGISLHFNRLSLLFLVWILLIVVNAFFFFLFFIILVCL